MYFLLFEEVLEGFVQKLVAKLVTAGINPPNLRIVSSGQCRIKNSPETCLSAVAKSIDYFQEFIRPRMQVTITKNDADVGNKPISEKQCRQQLIIAHTLKVISMSSSSSPPMDFSDSDLGKVCRSFPENWWSTEKHAHSTPEILNLKYVRWRGSKR